MIDRAALINIFPGLESGWYDAVMTAAIEKKFAADQHVIKRGEQMTGSMLLLQGVLKIYRSAGDGSEYFMHFLQAGQACAMSLRCHDENKIYPVSIRAASDAVLLLVSAEQVAEWMQTFKSFNKFVRATYFNRMDEMLSTIDKVVFQQMDERLLNYLEMQSRLYGNEIKLTHHQIAKDLNTSREVISRLLKKMEDAGRIQKKKNHLELIAVSSN